ncbi:uracil phosphoribosyltransferase [Candidatus Gottesmanbacteria bacterium RIFCSPHIGHO2_02_FULL_39_11]|uniref:Uracil phosphoribosyltransferase n=1 Tax=Candidatus Gottesmanbacteria bacterium RIFCSPHIGHO2_02_FULL_39_11 TaxID=1798382 RepID=A0A1F5ZKN7_9BACT|nr:MAG: uracil phosphoribosyltransferase [Candidatus Gottesmanbacteria bacterium RIFCSPHIGHO2_02_FULL_39_11]
MQKAKVLSHPFIQDALGYLRNKNTPIETFRFYSDRICEFLIYESLRNLLLKEKKILTPLTDTSIGFIDEEFVILPVLRSGIAMLLPTLHLLPKAKVGFIGLERNETTAIAREYYFKIPRINNNSIVLITDPMLATGGSTLHSLEKITPFNPKQILIICVIASQEGIKAIEKKFPNVTITTAVIDPELNSKKFIVPGLGDYGDRYFGTDELFTFR